MNAIARIYPVLAAEQDDSGEYAYAHLPRTGGLSVGAELSVYLHPIAGPAARGARYRALMAAQT